jgi:hypothetical protein
MNVLNDFFGIFQRKERRKIAPIEEVQKKISYQDKFIVAAPTAQLYSRNQLKDAINSARRHSDFLPYLEIAEQALLDDHLTAIYKTILFSLNVRKIIVLDSQGKKNDVFSDKFSKEWIFKLQEFYLKSRLLGFGCLELGNWIDADNEFSFITDVSRFLLRPETSCIVRDPRDNTPIIDLSDETKNQNFFYIFHGQTGEIAPALAAFISKNTAERAMDLFNSKQSGAFIIYKYDGNVKDIDYKKNMQNALANLVSSGTTFIPSDNEITILATPADSVNANIASTEKFEKSISKALLGQTMLFENGSSRSQAEVHQSQAYLFLNSYIQGFENFLNGKIKKRFSFCGLEVTNYKFKIDNLPISIDEKTKIYDLLLRHYDISENVIQENFNIEVENKSFRNNEF